MDNGCLRWLGRDEPDVGEGAPLSSVSSATATLRGGGASPRPRSARVESGPGTREEGDTTCLICPSAHDVTSGFFLRRLAPELADVISQAVFHITRSVKSPLH